MNKQLAYIENRIGELREKQKNQVFTDYDRSLLKLFQTILSYIKATLLHQISLEVMENNKDAISDYQNYLEVEIQKYSSRLQLLLNERKKAEYVKNIDKKIAKCKSSLEDFRTKRSEFLANRQIIAESPTPISNMLEMVFSHPLLATTKFYSSQNDFLIIDEKTKEKRLNYDNVQLVIEVFLNHKSDNLKKLVQIEEIEKNKEISQKDKIEKQNQIRETISPALQNANIHVMDRINYYCSSSLRSFYPGGTVLGGFASSEEINDQKCNAEVNSIGFVIDSLQMAMVLDSVHLFTRQDLLSMIGAEKVEHYQNKVQDEVTELTNRSR